MDCPLQSLKTGLTYNHLTNTVLWLANVSQSRIFVTIYRPFKISQVLKTTFYNFSIFFFTLETKWFCKRNQILQSLILVLERTHGTKPMRLRGGQVGVRKHTKHSKNNIAPSSKSDFLTSDCRVFETGVNQSCLFFQQSQKRWLIIRTGRRWRWSLPFGQ